MYAAREAIFGHTSSAMRRSEMETSIPMNPLGRDVNDDGSQFRGHWSRGMSPVVTDKRMCGRCSKFWCRWSVIIPMVIFALVSGVTAGLFRLCFLKF